jgi:hypothetical protein
VSKADLGFPDQTSGDERELLLRWLGYLRAAVTRKASGVSETAARWRPDARLICLIGIVNHLTNVEWRWIDGGMLGHEVHRSEAEFEPGPELTIRAALHRYRDRQSRTDATVRSFASLESPCRGWDGSGKDLRWVLLHLINETARHAGHADAVRELLDGSTGE